MGIRNVEIKRKELIYNTLEVLNLLLNTFIRGLLIYGKSPKVPTRSTDL